MSGKTHDSGADPLRDANDRRWDPFAPLDAGDPGETGRRGPADEFVLADDELWTADDPAGPGGGAAAGEADEQVETYRLGARPARPPGPAPPPTPAPPGVAAPSAADSQPIVFSTAAVDEWPEEAELVRSPRRERRRRRDAAQPRPVPDVPLHSAVRYPFQGSGLIVLLLYAFFLAASRLLPVLGPLLAVVVLLYIGLLFLETASFTLENIPGGPRFPSLDLADLQAGLFGLTVMLIGLFPYVALRWLISRLGGESPVWDLLPWPLAMFYLPMAFVVLADVESERGLDPRRVVRAIRQAGGVYFVLVTFAAAAFLVPAVTLALLDVPLPLLELSRWFLMMSVMAALLRAVGLVYLQKGIVAVDAEPGAEAELRPEAEADGSRSEPENGDGGDPGGRFQAERGNENTGRGAVPGGSGPEAAGPQERERL